MKNCRKTGWRIQSVSGIAAILVVVGSAIVAAQTETPECNGMKAGTRMEKCGGENGGRNCPFGENAVCAGQTSVIQREYPAGCDTGVSTEYCDQETAICTESFVCIDNEDFDENQPATVNGNPKCVSGDPAIGTDGLPITSTAEVYVQKSCHYTPPMP